MKPAAIVSLMIGGTHRATWEKYCAANWQAYANKYGLDLIIIDQPLDRSARAMARSPAWQKCLVWSQEFAKQYRQVILLDCDIAINARMAPLITDQVPLNRVGGTIVGSHIQEDLRLVLLNRLSGKHREYQPYPTIWREDQDKYYQIYRLSPFAEGIINTGVLVASPHEHAELFAEVYQASHLAETRGYEQIPLSHALLAAGVFQRIDTRFNSLFYESLVVHYPYLMNSQMPHYEELATHAVRVQYETNFFLHFAYDPYFMQFLGA